MVKNIGYKRNQGWFSYEPAGSGDGNKFFTK